MCTATLPCLAEMGGSIHIHGTGSSIIDTVFVCRAQRVAADGDQLVAIVEDQLSQLRAGGVKPTVGDIHRILFGHLARLAIADLGGEWDRSRPTEARLAHVAKAIAAKGDSQAIIDRLSQTAARLKRKVAPRSEERDAFFV
jgi:hypothetical protein